MCRQYLRLLDEPAVRDRLQNHLVRLRVRESFSTMLRPVAALLDLLDKRARKAGVREIVITSRRREISLAQVISAWRQRVLRRVFQSVASHHRGAQGDVGEVGLARFKLRKCGSCLSEYRGRWLCLKSSIQD